MLDTRTALDPISIRGSAFELSAHDADRLLFAL
jgi:hypothetical protein